MWAPKRTANTSSASIADGLEVEPQAPAHPDQDTSLVKPAESDFPSEADPRRLRLNMNPNGLKMTEHRAAVEEFQEAGGLGCKKGQLRQAKW